MVVVLFVGCSGLFVVVVVARPVIADPVDDAAAGSVVVLLAARGTVAVAKPTRVVFVVLALPAIAGTAFVGEWVFLRVVVPVVVYWWSRREFFFERVIFVEL